MSRGLRLQDLAFLGRVGNAGVTPLSFPGLLRWYRADSFSGIANDGDSIGGGGNTRGPWIDQTGSGDDATAGSGPIFKTNIIGAMPVIRFATALGPAMLFNPGNLADFTVVAVCQTTAGSDSFVFYNSTTAPGHQLRLLFFGVHDVVWYAGSGIVTVPFAGNNFESVGCKRSGTTISMRQNKVNLGGGVDGNVWTVNQIGNGSTGSTLDLAELLVYNTTISEANLDLLYDQYLKPRWVTLP